MTGEHRYATPRGQNHIVAGSGPIVQAQHIGTMTFAPGVPTPAQLRPAPAFFTNRREEQGALGRLLEPATECGKPPSVAPDGQFFVDLRQFSCDRSGPLEPAIVMGRFLRALGISPDHIRDDVEEQQARWRSEIAGRRVLIVADNAASTEQVHPLLPGSAPGVVVVTTRLPPEVLALDGAHELHLGPLDTASSLDLLQQIAGHGRLHAEPRAIESLLSRNGHLPLTVRAVGARARAQTPPTAVPMPCWMRSTTSQPPQRRMI